MRSVNYLLLLFLLSYNAIAQSDVDYAEAFYTNDGFVLPYRILYPKNFDPQQSYPMVLFLHGSGERGSDNEKQLVHGGSLFSNLEYREKFPAIVVFPQCPQEGFWARVSFNQKPDSTVAFDFTPNDPPTPSMKTTISLMDSLSDLSYIDANRIYVGGLSMGGMGTFEIVGRKPEFFAAAFPICGGGDPELAKSYAKTVPFWIFHGAKDDIVPPELSERMVKVLKSRGGEVRFTLYPEANHNSWDSAFAEPELLPWLFSKSK